MGIGQREGRKKADCHATVLALAAAVADPVMTAVMRLFGPPAEALDGNGPAQRALPNDLPRTSRPINAGLAIIPGTWDKRSRRFGSRLSHERILLGMRAREESLSFPCLRQLMSKEG